MDKKKIDTIVENRINFAKVIYTTVTAMMLIFLIIGELVFPDERESFESNCRLFQEDWYRVMEDGTRQLVQVPGKVDAEYGEIVTLETKVPKDIRDNEVISFRVIWQDLDVYIDGELRASYSTKDTRPFGLNSPMRYVFMEVAEEDAGKTIVYVSRSDSKYTGDVRQAMIGDRMSIWLSMIEKSGTKTVVSLILFVLSIFCIIACSVIKRGYGKVLPLAYLSGTLLLCSLWTFSENEFRQLIFKNVSVLTCCTYWSLMIIPIPLMIYINEIQSGRYKNVYILPIVYNMCLIFVGTILQVFDIVQFVEQLPFIHGGMAVAIVCIVFTIFRDTVNLYIKEYFAVGIGIFGMLFTTILELILYYVGSPLSLGTVLVIGLLFLLLMAIIKTAQEVLESEKKKQQAITAREAQTKFLANMSHEIRTPINAVIGMNEMILRESENDTVCEYANNIKSASNMLLGLVNDILDFSKIESGQLELVEDTYSLATLIKDEVLLLKARIMEKNITTNIEVEPYIPSKFYGDELRIKQILTNILSNAVKYTRAGNVTFKAFFKWIDSENIELCFSVKDTGVGIREEDLSKLFDSFKRLELNKNRNIEGTGLGLNIAKQLIDLMNGTIAVESEYGKGTMFTVSIPQKIMDKTPIGNLDTILNPSNEKVVTSTFVAPDAKILVVDDNSMNLAVIKGLLKESQAKLTLVASGKEAIEMTKKEKYDIILMDHMMPELDGVETLQIIKNDENNINRNTIVVALTANAVAGCREMYMKYGFTEYLSKPVEPSKLDNMLSKLLHRKGTEAQIQPENQTNVADEKLLQIDKTIGMSYCMNSEDVYKEILEAFLKQGKEYVPTLQELFDNKDWEKYAIVAHSIKSNSLTIGASAFSELSLKHEVAGKENNEEFILKEFDYYYTNFKGLIDKVSDML